MIEHEQDYIQACKIKEQLIEKGCHAHFALSPMFEDDKPLVNCTDLLYWMKRDDEFDWTINVQIHKILGVA